MPGADGVTVLRRLRRTSDTRCIMMTAWTAVWSPERLLQEGADAVLAKPFELQDVLWAIDHYLPPPMEIHHESPIAHSSET
jgi:DNA-binding response OmpR family regulator